MTEGQTPVTNGLEVGIAVVVTFLMIRFLLGSLEFGLGSLYLSPVQFVRPHRRVSTAKVAKSCIDQTTFRADNAK